MGLAYGKPQNWIEDMYSMQGDNSGPSSNTFDSFGMSSHMGANNAQYPQEVIISCPHKMGRVRASMGGPIQLNISSQWEPMFGGGIGSMSNSIIGVANQLIEWGLGATIQQPWMNRKNYKNTMPFTFTLPLNFVAIQDAKEDVVKPCLALVSFLYPRKYNPNDNTNKNRYEQYKSAVGSGMVRSGRDAKSSFGNTNAADEIFEGMTTKDLVAGIIPAVNDLDNGSVLPQFLDLFEIWEIPGPSLLTGSKREGAHKGDAIDIIVGKMFNLGNCYLENVDITFGSAFDKNGYPMSAKANVKCTCADSVVCSSTGNLLVNEVLDQTQKLDGFINSCSKAITDAVQNLTNLVKSYKGFYSGTAEIQSADS
jgi:hypothetical protein